MANGTIHTEKERNTCGGTLRKEKNTDEFIKEIDGWKPVVYPFILALRVL